MGSCIIADLHHFTPFQKKLPEEDLIHHNQSVTLHRRGRLIGLELEIQKLHNLVVLVPEEWDLILLKNVRCVKLILLPNMTERDWGTVQK
ncbi:hypothetical protein AVEN_149303-1 [Araneus ventricosus]|uniref:Uncharacterized protein n=1 Tax=Araneus ventricosus TaxID=182803 RepID=A0A4Y2NYG3_ARAVE|nr:hypothetical protein AVEN_149303-1 [Araneus ventricosus]